MLTHLFVYGTLKPGGGNYPVCQAQVLATSPAQVRGQLYELPLGYPAMVLGETGWVQGSLLTFADATILSVLDELEDYAPHRLPVENEYQRCEVLAYCPNHLAIVAWAYVMPLDKIQTWGGRLLPDGQW
ncbi:hypothetical protein DO97_15800 [Neosynechococcus sphagnicola sy1]|uniref:Gamma-glutamylcyclotransferase AIG2-like domain-containing protein n=1 Tax=Neosynechococcus sphagnicola sy1 TaxID=1497020 RepID=A0A098TLL9_9CYAN|nr:gamma-glutamylcyclotransferase family protein [Neosynechococcus sphagnicola]KGF71743.1 hypothetical protein DO97_15800 [Neosynechococcus sphagnicola sy1]